MGQFLTIMIVSMLVLGGIAYFVDQDDSESETKNAPLTLLPGDFKYQSTDGNFHFYFPIATSIVLSIALTLVLRFL